MARGIVDNWCKAPRVLAQLAGNANFGGISRTNRAAKKKVQQGFNIL